VDNGAALQQGSVLGHMGGGGPGGNGVASEGACGLGKACRQMPVWGLASSGGGSAGTVAWHDGAACGDGGEGLMRKAG